MARKEEGERDIKHTWRDTCRHANTLKHLEFAMKPRIHTKGSSCFIICAPVGAVTLPVVASAYGALLFELVIETVLVEGVFAEEVDGRQGQRTHAQTTLHDLEHLGTTPCTP